MSPEVRTLLLEYLSYAERERNDWADGNGDVADAQLRRWQAKINQIRAALANSKGSSNG